MTFQYARATLTAGVFHVLTRQNVKPFAHTVAATTIAAVMRLVIVVPVAMPMSTDAAGHTVVAATVACVGAEAPAFHSESHFALGPALAVAPGP